jgi:saccharopine dehydrogenase-like protein
MERRVTDASRGWAVCLNRGRMRILVVGTGGVGAAVAAVARRRSFFAAMTLADLDPSRPRALVAALEDDRFVAAAVDASDTGSLEALIRERRTPTPFSTRPTRASTRRSSRPPARPAARTSTWR